jgi:phage/plasmid-like protein (TIGR03299 family)
MTAEVSHIKGKAYVGQRPWHGLGTDLSEGADIETWKREAGLDFIVAKAPVLYGPEGTTAVRSFEDRFVTYRGDTGAALGIVSDKYQLVQPGEIVDFYRDFVAAGDMKLETAGNLKGGRRVWGLASLEHEIRLPGNDITRPYFLLTTSFDGETATMGTFTSVRVVCWNTLNMAYSVNQTDKRKKTVSGFSIAHHSKFRPEVAKAEARNLLVAAQEYEQNANLLAATGVNQTQVIAYFAGLVGSLDKKGDLTAQSRAKIDRMVQLYQSGPGAQLESSKGTAFGLLNAVTRFVDHEARERKDGSGRLVSAWYGPGKSLKARALTDALQLAVAA